MENRVDSGWKFPDHFFKKFSKMTNLSIFTIGIFDTFGTKIDI